MKVARLQWTTVVVVVGLPACADARKTDFESLCHAEERSGATAPGLSAAAKGSMTAVWLGDKLRTPEGKAIYQAIGNAPGPDKAARRKELREQAASLGVTPCPLAEDPPGP